MKLILASKSPRRSELLRRCGFDFTVKCVPAEELGDFPELALLPQENARRKAAAAAEFYPDDLILGADTMIIFDGKAIGKPADAADAAEILRNFSGKAHDVVTGIALICRSRNICELWSETSQVRFKTLDDATVKSYIRQVDVLDKAGAYAIQEHGEMIIAGYSGELENIIGLPLKKLQMRLNELLSGQ